jgi:hypothetical protein
MPRGISIKRMETMKRQIEELSKPHQVEILRILTKHHCLFTENRNGIFFDITRLDANIIRDITQYLKFCEESEKCLEERDNLAKELRNQLLEETTQGRREVMPFPKIDDTEKDEKDKEDTEETEEDE